VSRLVLTHESRHAASWLIFDVRQKMKSRTIFWSLLLALSVGAAVAEESRPTFFQQEIARSLGVPAHTLRCSPARKAHLFAAAPREDGLLLASVTWRGDAVIFQRDGDKKDFIAMFDRERLSGITEMTALEKRLWFEAGPPTYLARVNQKPNKAPEPTPGSVTPRATDSKSK
jgi:hypothetical protein